jgi:hypothetical protein
VHALVSTLMALVMLVGTDALCREQSPRETSITGHNVASVKIACYVHGSAVDARVHSSRALAALAALVVLAHTWLAG